MSVQVSMEKPRIEKFGEI